MKNLPLHPLQSPEWGSFREKTGVKIVKIANGFQMSVHPLPKLPWTIGYIPKCNLPTTSILKKLAEVGKENNCIFIKLEPNVLKTKENTEIRIANYELRTSPHPLFTSYSFHIDLTKSEDELLKKMRPKTRYNIRVAEKNGVYVKEETSDYAFKHYINLSKQTWKRQKFVAHGEDYHRKMWETLHPAGIAHLLVAYYKPSKNPNYKLQITNYDTPLTAWVLFLYNDVLYYPYGASSTEHKHVMASNLMMWEAIKWGKKKNAKLFDLWGSLGPEPDNKSPWYGFHRFKKGYGGELVEYVGSYDLVLKPSLYRIYNVAYSARQKLLGLDT